MFDVAPYLAIAGAVNRFVELLKPVIKGLPFELSDAVYNAIVQLIAILLGIVMVSLAPGLNLFVSIPSMTPILGIVLTGAVVGLGAEAIDAIVDLLYSWQRPVQPVVETSTPVTPGSDSKVTVTTTTSSPEPLNPFRGDVTRTTD